MIKHAMNLWSKVLSVALAACACGSTWAQSAYPIKPVRIVTAAAGGASDFAARILAQHLSASLGQPVIVENRGGASGVIAAQTVTKAPRDGHTLLLFTSPIWLLPFMQDNLPYDPVLDLAPISLVDRSPSVLVVHPSLPVASVRELIRLAKAHAGELNYARASAGGASHLAAELFMTMAGVRMTPIPYKGGGPAALAVVTGEAQLTFASVTAAAAPLKSQRLRALAVTSLEPSPLFPGIPAIASAALPGFDSVLMNGLFSGAGTPAAVVNHLSAEVARILGNDDTKQRFMAIGVEPVGSTPESFGEVVKAEMAKWGKLIRSAGIRSDS
jgi:tripartite-type tricarboxylate transporter receptor subunit TctC